MTEVQLTAAVAAILGWEPAQVDEALGMLVQGFMKPDVRSMDANEAAEIGCDEAGWYWRLSAPGYLDCSEWYGPFTNEAEATADMLETEGYL